MEKSGHRKAHKVASRIRFRALTGTALCTLFASYASAFAADKAPIEEIIVTAEKRAISTQNLAREIQAFSDKDLQEAGVKDVQNLQTLTPGLNFGNQTAIERIYLRGIGTVLAGNGLDAAVATYIDDRYVATNLGALGIDFLDIARVEVPKGPQGTLFGRNATAGAIRLITQDVASDFGGYVKATLGNYNAWGLQGAVNIPITPDLGIRLAALSIKHDGYSKNLFPSGTRSWDDKDLQEFRGKIHWNVNDRVTSDLTLGYWQRNDLEGNAGVIPVGSTKGVAFSSPGAVFSTTKGYVGSDMNGYTNAGHEFSGEWLLNIKAEPFNIVSISTGSVYKFNTVTDADASSLEFLNNIQGYQGVQDFSQEVRLVSNDENSKLKWLGGIYYYQGNNTWASLLQRTGLGVVDPGRQTLRTDAFATFGNATYNFTDQWALQLGARWSRESKNVLSETPAPPHTNPALTKNDESHWYNLSPEISLQYRPGFGLIYFKYSQGFKSGGFSYPYNKASNVSPEKLTAYELAYKGDLANGHLRFDAALFHYDYANMQVTVASSGQVGLPLTENAGTSTINGVELQTTAVPFDWLTVTAGGSWTDGHYDKFDGATATVDAALYPTTGINAAGHRLLWLSEWSYFVQVANEVHIGDGTLRSKMTWSWKSDFDFLLAANASPGLSFLTQKGYGVLNGRISYTPPNGAWEVAMWGNNLLDQDYYSTLQGAGGNLTAMFGPPRTFGADLSYKF